MTLYHLSRSNGAYKITKLDPDYHIQATYQLSLKDCSCPAGKAPTCRHRQMLPLFLAKDRVNRGWMLDWDKREWRKPLMEDRRTQPIDKETILDGWSSAETEREVADAMALAIGEAPASIKRRRI